jgi:hypothetical protein
MRGQTSSSSNTVYVFLAVFFGLFVIYLLRSPASVDAEVTKQASSTQSLPPQQKMAHNIGGMKPSPVTDEIRNVWAAVKNEVEAKLGVKCSLCFWLFDATSLISFMSR